MFSSQNSQVAATATQAEAIDFDGTNDYLSRSSDLVGNTNSQTFTFSCFVYPIGSNSNWLYLATDSITNSRTFIRLNPSSGSFTLSVRGIDASFNTCFEILNVSLIPANTWSSLIVSVNNALNTMWVSVNDVASSFSDPFSNTNAIDFTWNQHYVGIQSNNEYLGRMSNVFLDYTYRDLSVEANRRLFVTADLKPTLGQAALNPILYLPMSDPTAPGVNTGTGGNFDLTGVVARSGRGPNQYNAPYSLFDGANGYLSRTSNLTGAAASGTFTFAACIQFSNLSSDRMIFQISPQDGQFAFSVQVNSVEQISFTGRNAAGTPIFSTSVSTGFSPSDTSAVRNFHIVISVDLSSTSTRFVALNGQLQSVGYGDYTNSTINFAPATNPRISVGASTRLSPGGGGVDSYYSGNIGAIYLSTSYIDLSVPANLAKFVTGTGINASPVDLGATGQLPTGTSPLVYLPLYGNNAGRNYGTGGNFTVNSGPYTGARGPNEFWGNRADFTASPYLSRTTALTGITNTKQITLSFWATFDNWGQVILSLADSAGNFNVYVDNASNKIRVFACNASGAIILQAETPATLSTGTSYHIQMCADMTSTTLRAFYINGVSVAATWSYTNDTIAYQQASLPTIGAYWNGSQYTAASRLDGRISELYLSNGFVDFRFEANRLKFRDAFGNPVDLTAQIAAASIPTPAIYMRFPPTAFGTNSGTGGNFTVNGTITDGGQL